MVVQLRLVNGMKVRYSRTYSLPFPSPLPPYFPDGMHLGGVARDVRGARAAVQPDGPAQGPSPCADLSGEDDEPQKASSVKNNPITKRERSRQERFFLLSKNPVCVLVLFVPSVR